MYKNVKITFLYNFCEEKMSCPMNIRHDKYNWNKSMTYCITTKPVQFELKWNVDYYRDLTERLPKKCTKM